MADPWFFEVLPCRPPPYPGECLSGYLLRLAQANGLVPIAQLVSDLFPTWQRTAQTSLLRWEYPLNAWGRIPLRTQIPPAALERMTVLPWIAKFRAPPVLARPGHLGPGHFLRGIIQPRLQVCPLCLQAQPYVRLLWRLVPVRACLHHGSLLQAHCHHCGAPLSVIGFEHRHLHCPACDADLRQIPVIHASQEVLTTQQRRQADLQFLLDPDTTLINSLNRKSEDLTRELRKAIGLKFRYLRTQTGLSTKETAQQLGVIEQTVSSLERGKYATVPFYSTYLEYLSWTWADFAELEVPHKFVKDLYRIKHLALRTCPTPECPNHMPPPSTRVRVINDWPDRQRTRLWCTACGCSFVRTYDGKLVIQPDNPPPRPEERPRFRKSPEEITLLTQLGLQGEDNCKIAQRLGWAPKTVRWYWIVLGIEEQVHHAQVQRRERQRQQCHAAIHARLEAILQSMIEKDQEITLHNVSLTLGHSADYLGAKPDWRNHVLQVAQSHNPQVIQRRYEALETRISTLLNELEQSNKVATIAEIAQRAGIRYRVLHGNYPELHARVRQAVQEQKARIKAQKKEKWRVQIDEAAARLIDQGKRLTGKAIAREAGLSVYGVHTNQIMRELIRRWIGGLG